MHLITMSYGEYDDYNEIPILISPTITDARLIADDMNENPESEYLDYALKEYGGRLPTDAYFSVTELPVVYADSPSMISNRERKKRLLSDEISEWESLPISWVWTLNNILAMELPWRFLIRLVNRLRNTRERIQGA